MRDELNTDIESDENYRTEHLEKLDEHISICHIKAQSVSLPSTSFNWW